MIRIILGLLATKTKKRQDCFKGRGGWTNQAALKPEQRVVPAGDLTDLFPVSTRAQTRTQALSPDIPTIVAGCFEGSRSMFIVKAQERYVSNAKEIKN